MAYRILIVDDDAEFSSLLCQRLKNLGYDAFAVQDGVQAIIEAKKMPPDLIIIDFILPTADAVIVYHWIKESLYKRDIPTIFVTAFDLEKVKKVIPPSPLPDFRAGTP